MTTVTALEVKAICRYLAGVLKNAPPITMAAAANIAGRSPSWISQHFRKHKLPTLPQGWGKRPNQPYRTSAGKRNAAIRAYRKGGTLADAAASVGVHEGTVRRWMIDCRIQRRRGRPRKGSK